MISKQVDTKGVSSVYPKILEIKNIKLSKYKFKNVFDLFSSINSLIQTEDYLKLLVFIDFEV